jgi:hypothetical protein
MKEAISTLGHEGAGESTGGEEWIDLQYLQGDSPLLIDIETKNHIKNHPGDDFYVRVTLMPVPTGAYYDVVGRSLSRMPSLLPT